MEQGEDFERETVAYIMPGKRGVSVRSHSVPVKYFLSSRLRIVFGGAQIQLCFSFEILALLPVWPRIPNLLSFGLGAFHLPGQLYITYNSLSVCDICTCTRACMYIHQVYTYINCSLESYGSLKSSLKEVCIHYWILRKYVYITPSSLLSTFPGQS